MKAKECPFISRISAFKLQPSLEPDLYIYHTIRCFFKSDLLYLHSTDSLCVQVMATRPVISIIIVLLCLLNLSTRFAIGQPALKLSNIDSKLSDRLLEKGYGAMAIFRVVEYLDHLLSSVPSELTHNITAVTVFCPTD